MKLNVAASIFLLLLSATAHKTFKSNLSTTPVHQKGVIIAPQIPCGDMISIFNHWGRCYAQNIRAKKVRSADIE